MIDFLIGYMILLFVLSAHEYAHAWMANRCGDPTARLQGRMTLDPRAHIDPIGTVLVPLFPLIMGLLSGWGASSFRSVRLLGWAKPVPVNPMNVRRWHEDNLLISFAGCASGFLIALAAALLLRGIAILSIPPQLFRPAGIMLLRLGVLSIWLSIFNLIPIPPLDGYHIFTHLFRIRPMRDAAFLRAGPWLLLFLINTPILYIVMRPLNTLLYGVIFRAIAGL